ncbi:MAG: deaminase [bacterium]
MEEKSLILYVPVIHRGYLDFFEKNKNRISNIYLLSEELLKEISQFKPDIASIDSRRVRELLSSFGFQNVSILSKDNIGQVENKEIIFVEDEISRNFYERYLKGKKVEWASVFLRWDRSSVLSENPLDEILVSKNAFDCELMEEAQKEARKTGDCWRQIGAVLVKDGAILIRGYNQGLPSDHTTYQTGEVRDFFKPGERQDLANTIHAEQRIIAEAAKKGISLEGTSLYVTTFPCPVCAKLIACSGIKSLYFKEGGSNFDAKAVLESADVKIIYVKCSSI